MRTGSRLGAKVGVVGAGARRDRAGLRAGALGLALWLGAPGAARAAEPGPDTVPITVVALQTNDADDQAAALTKALKNGVRAMNGWSLGEGDYSLEVLTLSLKCPEPPDAACESRIADQVKADRFMWGIVNKKGDNVEGELHLWVRGKGTTKVDIRHSANLTEANDEALKKVADELLVKLTGGAPLGAVDIRAGNVSGQVFVDGQPVGAINAGRATFPLPAGDHTIVVKAPGHADVEGKVTVKPNATAEVALTPIATEAASTTDYRLIGGVVGVGASVALLAVGVVSSVQVNGIQNDEGFEKFRQSYPNSPDVCEEARSGTNPQNPVSGRASAEDVISMCDKAGTFEVMQIVFYGLGAVAGGVGIYLLATSGNKNASTTTGLTFQPQMSPTTGKLGVTYRW